MATEIGISGAGNQDSKNFYVDQNNRYYYNALYDNLPTIPGQFSSETGNIVEVRDWETGEVLYGDALNGLDISISNNRPVVPASIRNRSGYSELTPAELQRAITAQRAAESSSGGTVGGEAPPAVPGASAGQQVGNDTRARAGGETQNPPVLPTQDQPLQNLDPLEQNARTNPTTAPSGNSAPTVASGGGGSSDVQDPVTNISSYGTASKPAKDDAGATIGSGNKKFNQGKVTVPGGFLKKPEVRGNPLDSFAQTGYTIGLYLLSPSEYRQLVSSGTKSVYNGSLLIQSGGAPYTTKDTDTESTRNRFFDVDFFIDDLEMKSAVTGTATQGAHNVTELKFKIVEPNGITLLDRLKAAVTAANLDVTNMNYAAQPYLLVIRFFGYDEQGNIAEFPPQTQTDPDTGDVVIQERRGTYIEKFIPFVFKNISFKMNTNLAEYYCDAAPLPSEVGLGTKLASIPFNFELTGGTVDEILNGKVAALTTDPDTQSEIPEVAANAKSSLSNTTTVTRGLVQALNDAERDMASKQGLKTNVYKVEMPESLGIAEASVIPPGDFKDKKSRPTSAGVDAKNPKKGAVDNTKKRFSVTAGTPIVQLLQNIVQRSTFITDQQTVATDPVTGTTIKSEAPPPVTQWFKIRSFVKPLEYDEKRNDFVYEIKYVITPYLLSQVQSSYFADPDESYPLKAYDYWFTGENTSILDFTQDFNFLYYQAMTEPFEIQRQPGGRELVVRAPKVNSRENAQGYQTQVYEPGANLASAIYNPADQGIISLTIIGDPDYIQQNELLYHSKENIDFQTFQAWLPDGSINYDRGDVIFRLKYNTPADYNEETGLMEDDRFSLNNFASDLQNRKNVYLYRVNFVTSSFSRGKFTQTIEATLLQDKPKSQAVNVETELKYGKEKVDTEKKTFSAVTRNTAADTNNLDYLAKDSIAEVGKPRQTATPNPRADTNDLDYLATESPAETIKPAQPDSAPVTNEPPSDATTKQPLSTAVVPPTTQAADYERMLANSQEVARRTLSPVTFSITTNNGQIATYETKPKVASESGWQGTTTERISLSPGINGPVTGGATVDPTTPTIKTVKDDAE